MSQLLTFLSDPGLWWWVTVALIAVIIVGEALAKMFPPHG